MNAAKSDIVFIREFLTFGTNSKTLTEAIQCIQRSPDYQRDIEQEFGVPYNEVIKLVTKE